MRGDAVGRLSSEARVQWGLVTARQAVLEGVTRWDLSRLVADGGLEKVGYGVYLLAGAPQPRLLDLKVAWLQLDPATVAEDRTVAGGVISHTSAALAYGVGDFEPEYFEFTRPTRFRSRREDVVVHTGGLDGAQVCWVDQMLVTTPARTADDLLAARLDGEHVGRVFADLVATGQASVAELALGAGQYARAYGVPEMDSERFVAYLIGLVSAASDTGGGRSA
jgi:predicted transcriptional regulator of viral defense system